MFLKRNTYYRVSLSFIRHFYEIRRVYKYLLLQILIVIRRLETFTQVP